MAQVSGGDRVAVLVYARDAGKRLHACVRSLLTQTHEDLEVLVIDDGASDGSLDAVRAIDDARVRVLTHAGDGDKPDASGVSAAIGAGIAASQSEYFCLQGAQDQSHRNRIAHQLEFMRANRDVAVVFSGHELDLRGERCAPRMRGMDRTECRRAIARVRTPGLANTAMLRRDMVAEFSFDDGLPSAQVFDYLMRIGERHPMFVLGECLYTHQHDGEERESMQAAAEAACRRRGLPESYGIRFDPSESAADELDAHFLASSMDLCEGAHRYRAVMTGLRGSMLRPLHAGSHRALACSVVPLSTTRRFLHAEYEAPVAPMRAEARSDDEQGSDAPKVLVETPRAMRICLFGAPGDTGNHGVSALMHSAVGSIARFAPDTSLTVFDNGWGIGAAEAQVQGREFPYWRCGARLSRRYHRPECFANMRVSGLFGGIGNPGARAVIESDAVWDVSGGDSFGDIYGARHLDYVVAPKHLALAHGRPLILLPQTYGPFRAQESRKVAGDILRRSALAWARDERSFEAMKDLVGEGFDAKRHRVGVDMAFALEHYPPRTSLPERLEDWLATDERPTIGINVSGLIYGDESAAGKYELTVDYARLMRDLVAKLLAETDARVILVSHVLPTTNHGESDLVAAQALHGALSDSDRERVAVLPKGLDQSETKWVLSRLDWFCGTRMHACIGAMSSLVPTSGLAYSLKYRGVFETCGVFDHMTDLRSSTTEEALATIWSSWERRASAKRALAQKMPSVRRRAYEQMLETIEFTLAAI